MYWLVIKWDRDYRFFYFVNLFIFPDIEFLAHIIL